MNNFEENITSLPEEVILHILQFLHYTDITTLRLVCKDFYLISLSHRTVKHEVFIIKENYIDTDIIPLLMKSTRVFTSFKFIKVNFSLELLLLFEKYHETLLNLYLIDCDIEDGQFAHILQYCTELQSLHLSGCKSLLMAGNLFSVKYDLPNLNKLTFENCSYLTDEIFENFLKLCPNIRSVSLNGNKICFNTALCRRFYKEHILTKPSNCVFTMCYIMKILASNSTKIKELDFSNTFIDNNSLQRICTLEKLQLHRLSLSGCTQLSRFTALQLGSWQPYLMDLDLSLCNAMTDDVLRDICTHMTQLKFLNIANNDKISDEGVKCLKNLKGLEMCDISFLYPGSSVSSAGLKEGLNQHSCVQELRTRSLQIYQNDFLEITSRLNNVLYLDLCDCYQLSDTDLHFIFKNCRKLTTLLLSGCLCITDAGMTGIPYEYLKPEHEDQSDDSLNKESIDSLTGLVSLDLKNCRRITETTFHLALNLSDLRHLNLGDLKISDFSIDSLVSKCPRIEYLNLDNCDIDDRAVIVAVMNLKRLKYLHLRNCVKLTDVILEAIYQYCSVLEELQTLGCYMFSQLLLNKVASLPSLHKFNYSEKRDVHFHCFPVPIAPPLCI